MSSQSKVTPLSRTAKGKVKWGSVAAREATIVYKLLGRGCNGNQKAKQNCQPPLGTREAVPFQNFKVAIDTKLDCQFPFGYKGSTKIQ